VIILWSCAGVFANRLFVRRFRLRSLVPHDCLFPLRSRSCQKGWNASGAGSTAERAVAHQEVAHAQTANRWRRTIFRQAVHRSLNRAIRAASTIGDVRRRCVLRWLLPSFGRLERQAASRGIEQITLKHGVVLRHDRDHHGRIFQCAMSSRTEIYRANAEICRHQATLPRNASQKERWIKLAEQWSKLAEEAKQDRARIDLSKHAPRPAPRTLRPQRDRLRESLGVRGSDRPVVQTHAVV
jgi:hypothetical protein